MKPKALMLLAVAIGCGLVAMLGVQQAMQGSQKEVVVETRKVLTAIKDIHPGEPLTEENVTFKELPTTALVTYGTDVVMKVEEYQERALMISAVAGDAIRKSKLSEPGQYGASSQIPKGKRIFTFSATDAHTHSGMLRPGDKVDVTVAFTNRKGLMENKVLLECVSVFACENKTVKSEDSKNEQRARNVTLLLSPEQDGYIKIAQSRGQLSLALRNPDDDEIINSNGVNSAALDDLKRAVGRDDHPSYGRRGSGEDDDEFADEPDSSGDPAEKSADAPAAPAEVVASPMAPPVTGPAAGSGNVQTFLQGGANGGQAVDGPKKWTMKVYSGNELVNVDVDDVQPEPEAAPSAGGLPGVLKSLWSSGQKN